LYSILEVTFYLRHLKSNYFTLHYITLQAAHLRNHYVKFPYVRLASNHHCLHKHRKYCNFIGVKALQNLYTWIQQYTPNKVDIIIYFLCRIRCKNTPNSTIISTKSLRDSQTRYTQTAVDDIVFVWYLLPSIPRVISRCRPMPYFPVLSTLKTKSIIKYTTLSCRLQRWAEYHGKCNMQVWVETKI